MDQIRWILFFCILILIPFKAFSQEQDTKSLFFEHWRHYEGQGIPCEQCHNRLEKGFYSLPGHKVCKFCHKQESATDDKDASLSYCGKCHPKDNSSAITRLSIVPRKGKRYFFHSVKLKQLCDVCHGNMLDDLIPMGNLRTSRKERIQIRQKSHYFYNRGDCNRCHNNMSQKNTPENHTSDWEISHKEIAPQFNCRICHTKSYCQDCHESTY